MRIVLIILCSLICVFTVKAQTLACLDEVTVLLDDSDRTTIFAIDMLVGENLMNENYTINLDSAAVDVSSIDLFASEIGTHTYVVTEKATQDMCWGTLFVIGNGSLTSQLAFNNSTVKEGEQICISALGVADISLVSLQTGIKWDPSIIQYTGVVETGTLTGITVNESDVDQGELKFLWLIGFQEEPVVGEFGFDICFNVVGQSGEGTLIDFVNLPNFTIEASNGQGVTFPLSLQGGAVCIDTCPDFLNCQDNCGGRAEVAEGEIPLFMNPYSGNESVILFDINGNATTKYDNGTFGIPQTSIASGSNELSISSTASSSELNGISTIDIVMALQFVLGLEDLSPAQIIAADIDKSGDVSITNDISYLNKLILGIETDIVGQNWFFIPAGFEFDPAFSGFNFTNNYFTYTIEDTAIDTENGLTVDVYKYGDLNESFALNRSNEVGLLAIENEFISANKTTEINVKLSSLDIESFVGAQAALNVANGAIINVKHQYGSSLSHHIQGGQLTFTWISGEAVESIEFVLEVQAEKDGITSDFISLDETFTTEYITRDLQVFDIRLNISDITSPTAEIDSNQFSMYPNPASESFTVEVTPKQIGKDLRIFNTLGQLEYTMTITNQLTQINKQRLPSTGIKWIQIDGVPSQKLLIQ